MVALLSILVGLAVVALLVLEHMRSEWRWLAKALASTTFVLVAVSSGALASGYGRAVLIALLLSWVGDMLLVGMRRSAFLGGLAAFLLGHVAYVVAFSIRGVDRTVIATAVIVVGLVATAVWSWLRPHLESPMLRPVFAYVLVISAMVAMVLVASACTSDGSAPATTSVAAVPGRDDLPDEFTTEFDADLAPLPELSVKPESVASGETIEVSGLEGISGALRVYGPGGTMIERLVAADNASVAIPPDAVPGVYLVVVESEDGFPAAVSFSVTGGPILTLTGDGDGLVATADGVPLDTPAGITVRSGGITAFLEAGPTSRRCGRCRIRGDSSLRSAGPASAVTPSPPRRPSVRVRRSSSPTTCSTSSTSRCSMRRCR